MKFQLVCKWDYILLIIYTGNHFLVKRGHGFKPLDQVLFLATIMGSKNFNQNHLNYFILSLNSKCFSYMFYSMSYILINFEIYDLIYLTNNIFLCAALGNCRYKWEHLLKCDKKKKIKHLGSAICSLISHFYIFRLQHLPFICLSNLTSVF